MMLDDTWWHLMTLDDTLLIGVMTSSLKQLIELILIEEDETKVRDEDYFQSLEKNTKAKRLWTVHFFDTEVKQEMEEKRIDDIKCISGEVLYKCGKREGESNKGKCFLCQ